MTDTLHEREAAESTAVAPEQPRCTEQRDDEPMGGDPPCWAHLFEDDEPLADR